MNNMMKQLSIAMPIIALNRKADSLISTRPSGFRPIKKYVHGRKCAECLKSYDNYLTLKKSTRIIGNQKISRTTINRLVALRKMAR